jgi:hypothetical protein
MIKFPQPTKEFKISYVDGFIDAKASGFDMLKKWISQPKQVPLRDCV